MLEISLENIGKRFNQNWIFQGVDLHFTAGQHYAVLGPNGSGKSTFLQVVLSNLAPSEGKIKYVHHGQAIEIDQVYRYLSVATPYLELIEEYSLNEMIDFHFKFKDYAPGMNREKLIDLLGLSAAKNRALKFFSSGMKQRLKLTLACCTNSLMTFLDEPTVNLDQQGMDWYLALVEDFCKEKLLIVCSNQKHEYAFCQHKIHIEQYKSA